MNKIANRKVICDVLMEHAKTDKDIVEIFDLAEEIKVNTTNLKAVVGRKLAGAE